MKKTVLILSLALSFLAVSCAKENVADEVSVITSEEASINTKIDLASEDVTNIVDYQSENLEAGGVLYRTSNSATPSCTTISISPAVILLKAGETVTKTIAFDPAGCTLANGNVVKGKIIINFTYDPKATVRVITYRFENFLHNEVKLEGTKIFTREIIAATAAYPAHSKITMDMNLTATLPDGRVFTRTGERTREIVSGFLTPTDFTDDVYQITGKWTTTYPNTTEQTSTITTPLTIKMSCVALNKPVIVKGIITFSRKSQTATLDFGDGTCDNLAVFTRNGISVTIEIKK